MLKEFDRTTLVGTYTRNQLKVFVKREEVYETNNKFGDKTKNKTKSIILINLSDGLIALESNKLLIPAESSN